MENQIVIFKDGALELDVKITPELDTVWLTQAQMVELFNKNISTISRHINNIFNESEVERKSNLRFMQIANSDKPVAFYPRRHHFCRLPCQIQTRHCVPQVGKRCVKAISAGRLRGQ